LVKKHFMIQNNKKENIVVDCMTFIPPGPSAVGEAYGVTFL
jgi:hypothetical protein